MDAILDRVRASLNPPSAPTNAPPSHSLSISHTTDDNDPVTRAPAPPANEPLFLDAHEDWDTYLHVTDEFDDTGEGFGVEGDLELDED